MSRTDVLRSWLRSITTSAAAPLRKLPNTRALTQLLSELQQRRISISDAKLTAAVARAPHMQAVTVCTQAGRICLELVDSDSQELSATLRPHSVRFAPRGAKELTLRVEPGHLASHALVRDAMAAVANEIALAIWGPLLRKAAQASYSPYVRHEGDLVSIDLRDLPVVRNAISRGLGAALFDLIDVSRIQAETGKLVLQVRLPDLMG